MLFSNNVQCVLLFDRHVSDLATVRRAFLSEQSTKFGILYSEIETEADTFYRMLGSNEIMVSLEYIDAPAKISAFEEALNSPITTLLCADAGARLKAHESHIVVTVKSGSFAASAAAGAHAEHLSAEIKDTTLPQFLARLTTCALLSRMVQDSMQATLVLWTQSNCLLSGQMFDVLAQQSIPSQLYVHPFLKFGDISKSGEASVGVQTFGARSLIGREVVIEPNALDWRNQLDIILTFLRIALQDQGTIIADGGTFGHEGSGSAYRVIHRPIVQGRVPVYEIQSVALDELSFHTKTSVIFEQKDHQRVPDRGVLADNGNVPKRADIASNEGSNATRDTGRPPPVPGLWQLFWRRFGVGSKPP